MSKGQDQVQAALSICRNAAEALDGASELGEAWRGEAADRLQGVEELLEGVMPKFFLRTKLSIPFASRCQKAAEGLQGALDELDIRPHHEAQENLTSALAALAKAAKALEDASDTEGMTIT